MDGSKQVFDGRNGNGYQPVGKQPKNPPKRK